MGKTILTTRSSPFGDAGQVNKEMFTVLNNRPHDKSLYLQVQYMDLHAPNFPPDEYLAKFGADISHAQQFLYGKKRAMRPIPDFSVQEREDIVALYDACLAHIDQRIKEFCDELKRQGMYDDSLIIISADHGEAFFEHGDLGHHAYLYEENIRVPLLVKYPGGAHKGEVDERVASLIDVPATVAVVAGIERPQSFIGNNLAPGAAGDHVRDHAVSFVAQRFTPSDVKNLNFADYTIALRTKDAKLVVKTGAKDELYDLAVDPNEQDNLAGAAGASELYARMQDKLAPYLARVRGTSSSI
jgi:arylsulfatase A-like enzyme